MPLIPSPTSYTVIKKVIREGNAPYYIYAYVLGADGQTPLSAANPWPVVSTDATLSLAGGTIVGDNAAHSILQGNAAGRTGSGYPIVVNPGPGTCTFTDDGTTPTALIGWPIIAGGSTPGYKIRDITAAQIFVPTGTTIQCGVAS